MSLLWSVHRVSLPASLCWFNGCVEIADRTGTPRLGDITREESFSGLRIDCAIWNSYPIHQAIIVSYHHVKKDDVFIIVRLESRQSKTSNGGKFLSSITRDQDESWGGSIQRYSCHHHGKESPNLGGACEPDSLRKEKIVSSTYACVTLILKLLVAFQPNTVHWKTFGSHG